MEQTTQETGSTAQSKVITQRKRVDGNSNSLAHAIIPFNSLTELQKRFVIAYAGGASQVEAYLFASPESTREFAQKKAYLMLKNEKIAACCAELSSYKKKKYDFSRDAMGHRLMLLFGQIQANGGALNPRSQSVLLDIYKEINRMYGNYDHHENQITVNHVPLQIIIEQEPANNIIDIPAENVKINPSLNMEIDDGEGE